MAEAPPLLVFSDYACPWCYLGFARLRSLLREQPRATRLLPFPLNPNAAVDGVALSDYLRSKGIPLDGVGRLADLCEAEGLPYPRSVEGRYVWNTQRAQELALWAETQLEADAMLDLHTRLFAAYHVDNQNLYDLNILAEHAASSGLDAEAMRAALLGGEYAQRRREQWAEAVEVGVRGVPTFVSGQRAVVGAQSREVLSGLLA